MLLLSLFLGIPGAPCSLPPPLLISARMLQCLGRAHPVPIPPRGLPIPLEWKLFGFSQGPLSAGLELAPLPWEGGNWARPGSATHSSLFLRWLNVCFQIPEACVTPHLCPRWSLAWLAVASFLPLLGQAGKQGGVPGQVSLFPAAHQLGPEP